MNVNDYHVCGRCGSRLETTRELEQNTNEAWHRVSVEPCQCVQQPRDFNGSVCQYCGSDDLIKQPGDETFQRRIGCLSCNRWLTPVRIRG